MFIRENWGWKIDYKKREKKFYKLSKLATIEQIQWFESLFKKLKLYNEDRSVKYKNIIVDDLGVNCYFLESALYSLLADYDEPFHSSDANIVMTDDDEYLEELKNKEIY